MVLSTQLSGALRRFFLDKNYGHSEYLGRDIWFDSCNFNPVFLKAVNTQGTFEIPSLIKGNYVVNSFGMNQVFEYGIPLSILDTQDRRTSDSIFKYFFNANGRYSDVLGLRKAVTNKGEVYYGASGLILDKDMKPIMIGICEYSRGVEGFLATTQMERCVLKVSPSVFESTGIIEKAIIKKIIPYYTTERFGNSDKTVRVEIDDISKYIVRPVLPKANAQEELQNILRLCKDEIVEEII